MRSAKFILSIILCASKMLTAQVVQPLGFKDYSLPFQINIGNGVVKATDPSASLEVAGTSKGFLPPRVTTAQRDAIVSPAVNLVILNTDTHHWNLWNGSAWIDLVTAGATDTTSLSNRINLKLNISDTASMLANYLNEVGYGLSKSGHTVFADSATLSNYYLRRKDSTVYYPYASNPKGYLVTADVSGKLNISDTASMLANYFNEVGYGLSKSGHTVVADSSTLSNYYLRRKDSSLYTTRSTSVNTGYGLLGGGDLTTDRTHLVDTSVIATKNNVQYIIDSFAVNDTTHLYVEDPLHARNDSTWYIDSATAASDGFLYATDWVKFNHKVDSIYLHYGDGVDSVLYDHGDTTGVLAFVIDVISDGWIVPVQVVYSGIPYIYNLTGGIARIGGVRYVVEPTQVTIDSADLSDPRTDVFFSDTSGHSSAITGVPDSNPVKPEIDPSYQIEITHIDVPAGDAPGLDTAFIYKENLEWTVTNSGTTTNPDNTTNVWEGSKSLNVTNINNGDFIQFTEGGSFDLTPYAAVAGFIKLKGTIPNGANLRVQWRNGSNANGNFVVLNFNKTLNNQYQPFSIPLSAFNLTSTLVTALRITYASNNNSTNTGFYLDYIHLQNGIPPAAPAIDTANHWVNNIYANAAMDSIKFVIGNTIRSFKYTSPNANVGSGFRLAVPNTNNIKTLFGNNTITIDSTSNSNALTVKADTSVLTTVTRLADTASVLRGLISAGVPGLQSVILADNVLTRENTILADSSFTLLQSVSGAYNPGITIKSYNNTSGGYSLLRLDNTSSVFTNIDSTNNVSASIDFSDGTGFMNSTNGSSFSRISFAPTLLTIRPDGSGNLRISNLFEISDTTGFNVLMRQNSTGNIYTVKPDVLGIGGGGSVTTDGITIGGDGSSGDPIALLIDPYTFSSLDTSIGSYIFTLGTAGGSFEIYDFGAIGGYTDANARSAISLTTTGTSGAANYNSSTGVLNVPNYTYTLPIASASVLGGVKAPGTNISIDGSGTISSQSAVKINTGVTTENNNYINFIAGTGINLALGHASGYADVTISTTGGGGTGSNLSYNSGTHAIDIDGGGTSAIIPLADADGSTKGIASFSANDFNASSGNISTNKIFSPLTFGSTTTWDMEIGFNKTLTLTGDADLVFDNIENGDAGTLIVVQDGTGGHELTVPDQVLTINTDAGDTTVIGFIYDGGVYYWATSVATAGGGGSVATLSDVSLTSLATNDFLKYNGANWINRDPTDVKTDLSLNNVENTALSTWTGSTAITALGTIGTGAWQGTVIGSTYGGTGINNAGRTLTINTNSGTLAFGAASKTLTINNSIGLTGTDATTMTFPTTTATIARIDAAQTFTGVQTFSSAPVIGSITNTGTLTLPTVTGTISQYAESGTTSSGSPTPTGDARVNWYQLTALAANATFGVPSGSPANHNELYIRVIDNGTARTLAWNAIYRASSDLPLPTTTIISKTIYLRFVYNSASSTWDLIGFLNNF